MKKYCIHFNQKPMKLSLHWDALIWRDIPIASIDNFHARSSRHYPLSQVKIIYDLKGIKLLFRIEDKFIRSVHTRYLSKVHEDSCVEWFIQPPGFPGYYNFEMNAGGCLHVNYIIDPERDAKGRRKDVRPISEQQAAQITIMSSLPSMVDPEIKRSTVWYLAIEIPFDFFSLYTPINKKTTSIWRGNLYKCGDKTSHPHWASWNPITELNFHRPKEFGLFEFKDWETINR